MICALNAAEPYRNSATDCTSRLRLRLIVDTSHDRRSAMAASVMHLKYLSLIISKYGCSSIYASALSMYPTSRSSAAMRAPSSASWASWISSGVSRIDGLKSRTSERECSLRASMPREASSSRSSLLHSRRALIIGSAYSLPSAWV